MAKVKTNINNALKKVNKEIKDLASHGKYASALSSEGYSGGYRDALHDVLQILNNIQPTRRDYYDDWCG